LRHATGASSVRRSMTRSPRVVSRRTDIEGGRNEKKERWEGKGAGRETSSVAECVFLPLSLLLARRPAPCARLAEQEARVAAGLARSVAGVRCLCVCATRGGGYNKQRESKLLPVAPSLHTHSAFRDGHRHLRRLSSLHTRTHTHTCVSQHSTQLPLCRTHPLRFSARPFPGPFFILKAFLLRD
jgi:hypothetical protein